MAIDSVKLKMQIEKIIDFYQNLQAKRDSHTMSHFAGINVGINTVSHILAKGITTNTRETCYMLGDQNVEKLGQNLKVTGKAKKIPYISTKYL